MENRSILEAARAEVARRALDAEEAGRFDDRAVLGHLAVVADMVCRIGDHQPVSAHYRAEKAGPLLDAAVRLEAECLAAYAGNTDPAVADQLDAAAEVLGKVVGAARQTMWGLAGARYGLAPDAADAAELRRAAKGLEAWADQVAAAARSARPLLPDFSLDDPTDLAPRQPGGAGGIEAGLG
ncbi:MAG TPA: hypothetical protein VFJ85_01945 [Acidimicrobiales bacterium]|nr:hypothetical protein [Acidimicrobiales bacterium]